MSDPVLCWLLQISTGLSISTKINLWLIFFLLVERGASAECIKLKSQYSISSSRLYEWDRVIWVIELAQMIKNSFSYRALSLSLLLSCIMPAHTDLLRPSNDSRLMRHAQRSMPLSTALMHPAANFLPSTPVPCNKDRAINQAEIADTRHGLMK